MVQGGLTIFIVEDDPWYGEFLEYYLGMSPANSITKFQSAGECLDYLHLNPDLITLDYRLPDMPGSLALEKILAYNPDQKVIIISGQEDIKTAVTLLKEGAYDYIVKDDDTKERLWKVVNNISKATALEKENRDLRKQLGEQLNPSQSLVGQGAAMQEVANLVQKAADTQIHVTITGETGTGKELVSRAIHYRSPRKAQPFVQVNITGVPEKDMEETLFGSEKQGPDPKSPVSRPGLLEQAQGGTLLLDEICDLPLGVQGRLLQAIQNKTLTRVGGTKPIPIDLRFLFSTTKNLEQLVKEGAFREDLYYSMLGLIIALPALRDRIGDLPSLTGFFLKQYATQNNRGVKTLSEEAMVKLKKYSFPGNVRELKAMIELACVVSNSEIISDKDIIIHKVQKNQTGFLQEEKRLEEYTRDIINFYLDKYDQKVLLVADKLGISKSTIYNMLKNDRKKVK